MTRYLVTGGAGFIGSELCLQLADESRAQVTVVDKMTYAASPQSLAPLEGRAGFSLVKADICNAKDVDAAVQEADPDVIFHLAAETHVDRSIDGAAAFIQTNLVGTHNLLEAARRQFRRKGSDFRFVHVSTDEVFGSLGPEGYFTEETPYDPSSPYSASKAGSDHLVRAWGRTYGLPVLVSNCSNNFGPRQFPEKLIPLMILKALEGREMPVFGSGQNVRDWIHVEDHARALRLIVRNGVPGTTYAVGGGCERTNLNVVHEICRLMDERRPSAGPHERLIRLVPDRPGHDLRYGIDSSRIMQELGWQPLRQFEEGLAATVDWYLSNRSWWEPLVDGVYKGERLGVES